MEAKISLLCEELLREHREDLIQCMEDSLKVNDSDGNLRGDDVYQKMMGYYQMGKASIIGAFEDKRLIGYAQFFKKENGRVHLNELAVREDCQGKGVGTLLLREIVNFAKEWKITMVELFCNEGNAVAQKFYQKHKFFTEKRMMIKNV